GRWASVPRGAPASTQRTIVSICSLERLRSLRILRLCSGSAPHGGISRATTLFLMTRAHGRTSSYERKVIGATSPARWHIVHFSYMIGAMSLVNVGTAAGAVSTDVNDEAATTRIPAARNAARLMKASGARLKPTVSLAYFSAAAAQDALAIVTDVMFSRLTGVALMNSPFTTTVCPL